MREAVLEAIRLGYRHIDAAWVYENQQEVGEGIKAAIDAGIVSREELWVTTKLWNSFHEKSQVEPHLRDSLKQLQLDYVDLFLVHWPVTGIEGETLTPSMQETWEGMEEVLSKRLTKSIGVSNFSKKKLQDMKSYAREFPVVNQVELHPLNRQDELLEYCKSEGVVLTAYSPLGSPQAAAKLSSSEPKSLLTHPTIVDIATSCNKSAGQVLIRWGIQRETIVIPKSVTKSRIADNFDVFSWELSDTQMHALNSLEPQQRILDGKFFCSPNGPYRTVEELWDGP